MRYLHAFRSFTALGLADRMECFAHMDYLTAADYADAAWECATIVSTDRRTVHSVNEHMVCWFARRHGLPVLAWRLPLLPKYEGKTTPAHKRQLYSVVKDVAIA